MATIARPILFSAPLIRAIQEGRKTQTRRVVRPQPIEPIIPVESFRRNGDRIEIDIAFGPKNRRDDGSPRYWQCPFGLVGDILWVRETFHKCPTTGMYSYRADGECPGIIRWTPSIHMPRELSRIHLEVTQIGAERVQWITEEDAIAEGFGLRDVGGKYPREAFQESWDKIYAKRGFGWNTNPLVWRVDFKVVDQ